MNVVKLGQSIDRAAYMAAQIAANRDGGVISVYASGGRASLLLTGEAMAAMYPGAEYRPDPDGKASRAKVEHQTEWGAVELVSVRINYGKGKS